MLQLVKQIPEGRVLGRQEYWSVGNATIRILFATRYCTLALNDSTSQTNITQRSYRRMFWFPRKGGVKLELR